MEDNEKYNAALSGTGKEFTFEVMVKPASTSQNSVLLSKGDTQVALKTQSSGSGLEFFVYNNGSWKSTSCGFPEDWTGKWHQVVGVYDKGNLKIYVDGEKLSENTVQDSIASSSRPVGIGYDAEKGRKVDGEISIARIYNKALSAEEINGQRKAVPDIATDDSSVLLWMDYADEHETAQVTGWDYYATEEAHTNLYSEEIKGNIWIRR